MNRVGIVATSMPHQKEHAQAMLDGLQAHGIEARIYPEQQKPPEETVICWGWRIGRALREAGKQVLVMERGYIDRNTYASLGWNGLNGRAHRLWLGEDASRFANLFARALRPWNASGRYALVIGQVPGDESIRGIDMTGWYRMAVFKAYELGFGQVRFRPHPVALEHGMGEEVHGALTDKGSLSESIAGSALVVTFNSNTGVEALLAGKPTIATDAGSMAYPIAAHDFSVQGEPVHRAEWAARLAWSQFSISEIRSGFAWDVVKDSPARTIQ